MTVRMARTTTTALWMLAVPLFVSLFLYSTLLFPPPPLTYPTNLTQDFITISNSYLHDHWKGSLVGHSDNNQAEDSGRLHVTYANNHFFNLFSRGPMFRIGTGHLFNNYWDTMGDGVRTRAGAQLLIESSVFENTNDDVIAKGGFAVVRDVDLGVGTNEAPEGTLKSVPYKYDVLGSGNVKSAVVGVAGATLVL